MIVPLVAILLKIDWPHFIPLITSESSRAALLLSLKTATASTAVCVLIGVPMALVLARGRFPGQSVLRALVLLPLVLPPVVGGIALLYTFGRQGLLGQHLEACGIRIAFSTTAVVLAQSFVSLPFLVVSLEGALRTAGNKLRAHRRDPRRAPDHRAVDGDFAAGAPRTDIGGGARVRPIAR